MHKLYGNTLGLKPSEIHRVERIYRRRIPPDRVVTLELCRYLCELSFEIKRQIGLLANRAGNITLVVVGDSRGILIPPLPRYRTGPSRLRGLRCIHTHLHGESLTRDDLTDLARLRLDFMAALEVNEEGMPGQIYGAHLLPSTEATELWSLLPAVPAHQWSLDFAQLVQSLEEEFTRLFRSRAVEGKRDRAILVHVSSNGHSQAEDSVAELKELADSSGVSVLDSIIQHRPKTDPKYLLGKGKLQELIIRSLQLGADTIIFDHDLTPAQARSIADATDLKIIDRTQLILDIFAQRAQSREGKIQVELAQLKYLLPKLVGRGDSLSRLAGGIGGRGPGETKLEIDRRRARDRIHRLEREIEALAKRRMVRRTQRGKKGIPVVAIVGYTNAGKSTLLNTLTHSQVLVADQLFATLDPASRRLRLPQDQEIIISDTVGLIRNLPKDLTAAFRATLDELHDADFLLHVVDMSNPECEQQMSAVTRILADLGLAEKPLLTVFNKVDKVSPEIGRNLGKRHEAVVISALRPETLATLLEKIQSLLRRTPAEPGENTLSPHPPNRFLPEGSKAQSACIP
ncbi:MAG: GTPase HflX [Candidatus Tectomicrobia bacterium]|uniref:GTPase HflX n=1 Tax=Tectimicrobiota bacterium TaxID=2528274 RepID=A0A932M0S4_UNCTE|nr:GTPase HflX [Candidatus Tectomicrobia bacterium]